MTRERKLRSEGTAIEYMNRRPAQQSSASKPSQGERAQMCLRNFEYNTESVSGSSEWQVESGGKCCC